MSNRTSYNVVQYLFLAVLCYAFGALCFSILCFYVSYEYKLWSLLQEAGKNGDSIIYAKYGQTANAISCWYAIAQTGFWLSVMIVPIAIVNWCGYLLGKSVKTTGL